MLRGVHNVIRVVEVRLADDCACSVVRLASLLREELWLTGSMLANKLTSSGVNIQAQVVYYLFYFGFRFRFNVKLLLVGRGMLEWQGNYAAKVNVAQVIALTVKVTGTGVLFDSCCIDDTIYLHTK